jgi:hypothetical protein
MAWVLAGHARLALSGVQQLLQDTANNTLQRTYSITEFFLGCHESQHSS